MHFLIFASVFRTTFYFFLFVASFSVLFFFFHLPVRSPYVPSPPFHPFISFPFFSSLVPLSISSFSLLFPFTLSQLSKGTYNITAPHSVSQRFPAKKTSEPSQYVALKIVNNYGNADYTCLYRLRVHDKPM